MSQRCFISMGFRLLGVYALLYAAASAPHAGILLVGYYENIGFRVVESLGFFAPLAVGLVLLVYGDRLAKALGYTTEPMGVTTRASLGGREIQAIGFSLVGVLVLVRVAGQLPFQLDALLLIIAPPSGLVDNFTRIVSRVLLSGLSLIVHIGVGLGLLFGARRLADWWHDRYAPAEKPEAEQ